MPPRVMSLQPTPNFHFSHWNQREACQTHWHAFDTDFGNGQYFLDTLEAWRRDAQAPPRLFYTALTESPPQAFISKISAFGFGLLPGVHRLSLAEGRVQLTLCIGPGPQMAKEIDIAADSINAHKLNAEDVSHLARLSKTGTILHWTAANSETAIQLQGMGFQMGPLPHTATYRPAWKAKTSLRTASSRATDQFQKAVVIGAGLAGSAVAYSLAQRGWQVEVIDQGAQLGAGASGLPAGIFATHVSPDNNVLSRITRDGVRATVQRADALLKNGFEWQMSQLLEHRFLGKRQLPQGQDWSAEGLEWSSDADIEHKLHGGLNAETSALWHSIGGWIQTQALVQAQLKHEGIVTRLQTKVAKLVRQNSEWHLIDSSGATISIATHVVLATAHACQELLDSVATDIPSTPLKRPHLPVTALRGQVSYGPMQLIEENLRNKLPKFPVNGHGSYIGEITPFNNADQLPYWIVGSSFQRHDLDTQTRLEDQLSNHQQWAKLMPAWQAEISSGVDIQQSHAWAGIRAALPNRLPAVGALNHPDFAGLHICAGMGARGISWSVLCGELLAAQMNHEPLPMATSLAKLMAASRFG